MPSVLATADPGWICVGAAPRQSGEEAKALLSIYKLHSRSHMPKIKALQFLASYHSPPVNLPQMYQSAMTSPFAWTFLCLCKKDNTKQGNYLSIHFFNSVFNLQDTELLVPQSMLSAVLYIRI